ncbi:Hypothetical protein (Fragment) [Durusdinium trenchii]|uniref:BLUF domain-containing protein n=1 Tax=Durusdinium trenchii TaxID=1381693 RepID=A0ABP0IIH3_9DINO
MAAFPCWARRFGFHAASFVGGAASAAAVAQGRPPRSSCRCDEPKMVTRISYTSTMRGDPQAALAAIRGIVDQSTAANLTANVSGHMCYDTKLKSVWQVLEGAPEVVSRLWEGICKDERHVVDEDTVHIQQADHRAYPVGWGMRCTRFEPGMASNSDGDCAGTNLMQLMYKSVIHEEALGSVKQIVPRAVEKNRKNGITGWMLYNDRTQVVYQVLEGPPEQVERSHYVSDRSLRRLRLGEALDSDPQGWGRKDVCDYIGIAEGARVRAHYFVQGQKSHGWREAQVLKVGVHMHFGKADTGPGTFGVLLQFGFGTVNTRKWVARQVVPPTWILSGVEDASVASALRESGILDEQQAFWGLLLPETEMQAIARLESCQRKALYTVRAQATKLHDDALPRLRERFQRLGYGDDMLGTVLDWIQDLAPVVVHVHLDRVGAFLEVDEFYRNQFETKTSCGALDPENRTRQNWENVLFGGAYDGAKPFDRPKYGALSVMNDYRGVISARQYGDSYLVLKDVRLRCTFAGTDSGGISSSRLAVLDKYAHVLSEYQDHELHGLDETLPVAKPPATTSAAKPPVPAIPVAAPVGGPPSLESLMVDEGSVSETRNV